MTHAMMKTIEYSVPKRGRAAAKQLQLTAACVLRHLGRAAELYERGRYDTTDPDDHDSYGGNPPVAFGVRLSAPDREAWQAFIADTRRYKTYLDSPEFRATWQQVVRDDNSE